MTYTFTVIDEVTRETIENATVTVTPIPDARIEYNEYGDSEWIFDALREFGHTPAGREWARQVIRRLRAKRSRIVVHSAADRTESRRKRAGRRRTKRLAAARRAR